MLRPMLDTLGARDRDLSRAVLGGGDHRTGRLVGENIAMPAGASLLMSEGQAALARGEWAVARACFEEAVVSEPSPAAYEGLGVAARYQLDASAALRAHEGGYALARAAGDDVVAARLAVQLGFDAYAFRGPAEAQGWVERAAMLVDGAGPNVAAATIPLMRAHLALLADHDPDRARQLAADSLELAREIGDVDVEMRALALDGLALVSVGDVAEGMRLLDAAAAAALGGEMTDADAIETVLCFVIDACRRVRDVGRAREWCDRVREVAARFDDRQMFSVCRTYYGEVLVWLAAWEEAEAELLAAAEELASIRPGREIDALVRLAELRRRQGRTSEAEKLAAEAETHRLAALVEGAIALERGDAHAAHEAASRYLRRVGERDVYERVPGLELVVRAGVASADPEADAACAELVAIAARSPTPPLRAAACVAQAALASARGEYAEAQARLQEAIELFGEAGAAHDAALGELTLASVHELAGHPGEARRSRDRARRSLDVLGARAPEPRPGGLSAREAEVLRLLARGLSNDDIAHDLVLSVRTVERHVANAYAKIGASGRTARAIATAWAHAHGIT
jgi:DNA-binding NarL/FixJ family response regulator